MTAIRTKIILTLLTMLFSYGGVLPGTALSSDGGVVSRGGSFPVMIGGGPSGISRGATGVHSIPFGNRDGIRNMVNIDEWQSDSVNVVDFAGTEEVYPDGFWGNPDFASRLRELDAKTRKIYVDGITEFLILFLLEQPYESNVQRILHIEKLVTRLQSLGMTDEK